MTNEVALAAVTLVFRVAHPVHALRAEDVSKVLACRAQGYHFLSSEVRKGTPRGAVADIEQH